MMMGMCALREIRVPYIGYSCALYWVALLGTLIPRFEDIRQLSLTSYYENPPSSRSGEQ